MKFEVTGRVDKVIFSTEQSKLYSIIESTGDREKKWAIWSESNLNPNQTYTLRGVVSEYKDKKLKYSDGKDVWKTGFSAKSVDEDVPF